MGCGSFTSKDWSNYASRRINNAKSVNDIYTSRCMKIEYDPRKITFRESCDSESNPNSTPIIVGLDVTGSMGAILDKMAREGLKKLVSGIYDKRPVSDPHVMFMGIGDVVCDRAPLQVTQFEADIRIAQQMTDIYFERGGGGNNSESYTLAWYYAATHTEIDSLKKRGKKGYLFTMGDDCYPDKLLASEIESVTGENVEKNYTAEELLDMVSEKYEVFHFITVEGRQGAYYNRIIDKWRGLLGERAIVIDDYTKIAEIMVSTLQLMEGQDMESITKGWDGSTAIAVADAIGNLKKIDENNGLILF